MRQKEHILTFLSNPGQHKNADLAPKKTGKNTTSDSYEDFFVSEKGFSPIF